MATTLVAGDIAIVQYNTVTDAFSFVFLRDVEAGTTVNFTDDGWLAGGGFRPGEGMVTYTAPSGIAAGTVITLSGLDLDAAGDQIIAYQDDPATPTILHVIDFADGNNTVAGDATDAQSTALPPGFTLGVNAAAVPFDQSIYAGPTNGSAAELFATLNNSASWLDGDGLLAAFISNERPTIDLDSDNSTHTGRDYETLVVSGGPAVPVVDTDIAIGDDDDIDIFAAEIKVLGNDSGDFLAINGSLPGGIVPIAYHSPTGILRLEGRASHADYEAAIRQVEFSTDDAPLSLTRVQVSVYDGRAWSHDGTAFIHVSGNLTAVPPGLDLDANNSSGGGADATATYTVGGPAISVTDVDVSITDADSTTIESATITILGWSLHPGDMLAVAGSLPGGITASSYNPTTGVITLGGSASLADYQAALRQVVYSSTLPAPSTADRGIQVTVNDGALTSNVATMYMHVAVPPPNIAPVLDLDANDSTTPGANYLTGFTEGGPAVAVADTDVLIVDSDSPNLTSATITLTNPQTDDVLIFDGTPPAGVVVSGSGTAVITLTSLAPSGSYQAAAQQIKFSNNSIDPSNATRVIEVVVNDGISNSNTATAVVQVEAVNNSAPVIDLDPDDSGGSLRTTFRTTFTENGAPIPIADADTSITDLDSTELVSATITLANPQTGDLLTIAATLPLPGGITTLGYDPGTGVLTLTGAATLDQYEAALQQVLFSNSSDDPFTVDRLIEVVVSDGANDSNVAAALINVAAVNDGPAIAVDTPATYVENAAASTLSTAVTLTDIDDADLNGVVVQITDGSFSGDGDILTVGGSTGSTVNGITFFWDAAQHAMVFTGASSVANYQALLQTVEFQSTSDNPTDFNASPTRTLTWTISDGTAVTIATTTLTIVAINDAPQEAVAAAAAYAENAPPLIISPAAAASDVDDINLVAGQVRIVAGWQDGDILTVNGLQSGTFSGIDFSYNTALRSLTFTRPASVADYQAFMQAVQFQSTSENPTNFGANPTRTLRWGLHDGTDYSSAVQTTVLTVTALDDPGMAQDDDLATPETVDVQGDVLIDNGSGDDSDPDSALVVTAVNGSAVNIGSQITLLSGARLTVNADGTFTYDPNGAFNAIPGPDSGASNTVRATDSFDYTLAGTDTATVTLTITGVDTPGDVLLGTSGDDTLIGGIGNDMMTAGDGNDAYIVDASGDRVTEIAGDGDDTVKANVSYALTPGTSVELLRTFGSATTNSMDLTGNEINNKVQGNAADNVLNGGGGNDTLYGFGGEDTLIGGNGDDVFIIEANDGDQIVEAAGGGNDTVKANVSYTLTPAASVELLRTFGSATTNPIDLTGNELDNTIQGNAAANVLDGGDGNDDVSSFGGDDILIGGNGDDTYRITGAGTPQIIEAAGGGNDTVIANVSYTLTSGASVESMRTFGSATTNPVDLTGNEFDNKILGNAATNLIDGGAGNDTLYGFDGDDFFLCSTKLNATTNVDMIKDFTVADDTIRLDNAIFKALSDGALAAGAFNIGSSATQADDRIIYDSATGALIYDSNGNAGGGATRFATLSSGLALTNLDFVVM